MTLLREVKIDSDTVRVEMASGTDVGQLRERNEDAVRIFPERGFAILADGMGGHLAGDIASRMAVEIVGEHLLTTWQPTLADASGNSALAEQILAASLQTANDAIRTVARSRADCYGMGATVVLACFGNERMTAANLGDSRLYRYWNGRLQQLTEDHTLAQQYVRQGVIKQRDTRFALGRNLLTRGLGISRTVEPGFVRSALARNQIYLMCSDGLTDAVAETEIADILSAATDPLQQLVDRLIATANDRGGPDNISVVLIRTSESS